LNIFHSLSIRKQLLLIVLIAALPAAGIILYSGVHQREEAVKTAQEEVQKLAATIASEQRIRAASAEQLLRTLALLPEVKRHQTVRVEPLLRDLLKMHDHYSNIFIADRSGDVWASAVPSKQINVADRRYFKNSLASGQLASGEYLVSRFTNKNVLTMAYPYKDVEGNIAGVIILGFDLDYYKHLFGSSDRASRKGYVLLDYKGVIMARPVNPEQFVGKQYNQEQFQKMQQGPDESTIFEQGMDGKERIISYRKLRLDGEHLPYMYIRTGIPVETVLSAINKSLFSSLGMFTLFFLGALMLAWLIGKRSIVDRVALLKNASHRMAGGDLLTTVSDKVKGGELGSLGRTFDHMALQLKARDQEKSALIQDLQQALTTIKSLQGILPICSSCKKIRSDEGQWTQLETYISGHTEAEFSHGLCPDCARNLFPDYYDKPKPKPAE